ncbi:folylpolyglutamate synthase [Ptychographa xylographoides]|nr:folylpolyglutamate synthase [Ptychographa xylographoides]
MIELGLARISRLLGDSHLPWRAIHVAGTNGKGSVCAYASSMLHAAGVRCGRFTSPHLIDRWDCITINEKTVAESLFREVEGRVQQKDTAESIGASEFELLTATAFEIFAQEKVKIGVVEVGMGGRLDATNVLKDPLVTVITKIGKDHEAFLGSTIEAIAREKAGVMKLEVPCVVDGSNHEDVLRVLVNSAEHMSANLIIQVTPTDSKYCNDIELWKILSSCKYQKHQRMNISLAYDAVKLALARTNILYEPLQLVTAVQTTSWPGRLQTLSIQALTGRKLPILLDGAHNAQSAEVLRAHVKAKWRHGSNPITWVLGFSKGKDIDEMLPLMLEEGDNLAAVEFDHVDGMPWVQATPANEIIAAARRVMGSGISWCAMRNVKGALQWATDIAEDRPVVVAGSLYLVSDVLRLLRDA